MAAVSKPGNDGVLKDFLIIAGLIAVQLVGATYMVLLSPVLQLGFKPLFLVTFGSLATAIFVFPFAVIRERKKWPSRISFNLVAQFVLIALGGVTTFQALMLIGVKKTTPAIASAMPNLAPGIIFLIAVCLGFEKVDLKYELGKAKVLGTFLCLGGAMIMSLLQSPTPTISHQHIYKDWLIGCLSLLGAVLVVSCSTVLQAVTMVNFPAPFTLCSVTSFIGAFLTACAQIITEGKMDVGNPGISIWTIFLIVVAGALVSSVCLGFQTWAVKAKGPVLVSMFSPIQTVSSAILSAIFLGQMIKLASLIGMVFMFGGLYMVLWAKKQEELQYVNVQDEDFTLVPDIEAPLLS